MPTDRFRRLPAEKQRCIREAAIEEFIRVPFDKASINKIIRNANISRGSFYTYFTDKKDLLVAIFDENQKEMTNFCREELIKSQGDFFKMLEGFFERCLDWFQDGTAFQLVKNVMLYQDNHDLFGVGGSGSEEVRGPFSTKDEWMYDCVNLELMKCKSREDFQVLLDMATAVMAVSISHYYKEPEKITQIRKQFRCQMEILRFGAMAEPLKKS